MSKKLTEEQMAKGRKRFLDANPDVARRIAALTEKDAEFAAIALKDLRDMETMKAFSEYAKAHGKDSQELFLSCIADTAEEFVQLNEARLQAIQRAIGL